MTLATFAMGFSVFVLAVVSSIIVYGVYKISHI